MGTFKRIFLLFNCLILCLTCIKISDAQENKAGKKKIEEKTSFFQAQLISLMQDNIALIKKIKDLEVNINRQNKVNLELQDRIENLRKESNSLSQVLKEKAQERDELRKQIYQLKAKKGEPSKSTKKDEKISVSSGVKEGELEKYKERVKNLEKEKGFLEAILNAQAKYLRQPGLIKADEKNLEKAIHLNLGFAYGIKGKIKEAIKEYQMALKYDLEDKDIHYNLGYLLAKENRFEEAIEEYKKALKGSSQDKEIYYNLAIIYATGLKDQKTAEEYYQGFLELSSSDTNLSLPTEESPQKE